MLKRIVDLQKEHAPGLEIMAGGGVRLDLIAPLTQCGVHAIHSSASHRRKNAAGAEATCAMDPELAATFAEAITAIGRPQ